MIAFLGTRVFSTTRPIDVGIRRLIWIGEHRTLGTINAFFEWFGAERMAHLRFVCSDMWKPYLRAIREKVSHALHILDRFHIVAHLGKAIDEVRAAMGYDKINLNGGSFGTYAAQIYMRRHGEHARSAYLTSLVTLTNRVPLYHAEAAQLGLDQLFKDCDQDAAAAFLRKAIRHQQLPEKITIDQSGANTAAIRQYNRTHKTAIAIRHSQSLNNLIDQDHRAGLGRALEGRLDLCEWHGQCEPARLVDRGGDPDRLGARQHEAGHHRLVRRAGDDQSPAGARLHRRPVCSSDQTCIAAWMT